MYNICCKNMLSRLWSHINWADDGLCRGEYSSQPPVQSKLIFPHFAFYRNFSNFVKQSYCTVGAGIIDKAVAVRVILGHPIWPYLTFWHHDMTAISISSSVVSRLDEGKNVRQVDVNYLIRERNTTGHSNST